MEEKLYPGVFARVKAAFIDAIVIYCIIFLVSDLYDVFGFTSAKTRTIIAFATAFFYDPLGTSLFGCTFGHRFIKLRVRDVKNENKNISFPRALLRFVLKSLLGWISLFTVQSNDKRLAIHDSAVGSVVVYYEEPS